MKILERPFGELALLECQAFTDSRGYFRETFRQQWLEDLGIQEKFVQDSHSHSQPGVLRGLHFQVKPPQGQLVSVRRGKIWDAVVDVRASSPTFGQNFTAELSADNGRLLWIPPGFAHGFCVLGDEPADVCYKATAYYQPGGEGGLLWNDPALKLAWPAKNPIISSRDAAFPLLSAITDRA